MQSFYINLVSADFRLAALQVAVVLESPLFTMNRNAIIIHGEVSPHLLNAFHPWTVTNLIPIERKSLIIQ